MIAGVGGRGESNSESVGARTEFSAAATGPTAGHAIWLNEIGQDERGEQGWEGSWRAWAAADEGVIVRLFPSPSRS